MEAEPHLISFNHGPPLQSDTDVRTDKVFPFYLWTRAMSAGEAGMLLLRGGDSLITITTIIHCYYCYYDGSISGRREEEGREEEDQALSQWTKKDKPMK